MWFISRIVAFFGAIAVVAVVGAGIVSEALHAARMRTVATQFVIKLPTGPADAQPGDVVLVSGTLSGNAIDLGYGNPSFPGAFMARRELEWDRGWIRTKWRSVESQTWVASVGRLGPWTLPRSIMAAALDGSRMAVPQREFGPPKRIKGEAAEATALKSTRDALEFNARGRHYRISYQVWQGNQAFTVLAQVTDAAGNLAPFRIPNLAGAPFSAMAAGAHPDPAFLLELGGRDRAKNGGLLLLMALAAAFAWYAVLRWTVIDGLIAALVPALWRGAATAAPMALVAFWPATSGSFIWIAAASTGAAAGVLLLLLGLLFVEFTR